MSRFKETADKARQDAQATQQQLEKAQAASFAQATQEKQRLEQECEGKLQTAKELLSRVDAQTILSSVKDEVWRVGEIIAIPGNFKATISKSPQNIEWPSISLVAERTGLSRTIPASPGGGRGPGAHGPTPAQFLHDGFVRSILKIMAATYEEKSGLLIYRRNEENVYYLSHGLSQTGNTDHQKIRDQLKTNSGVVLVNDYEVIEKGYRDVGKLGETGLFIDQSAPDLNGAVLEVMDRIVYNDVASGNLPKEEFSLYFR